MKHRLEGYLLGSYFIGTLVAESDSAVSYLGYAILTLGVFLTVPVMGAYSPRYRFWGMLALAGAAVVLGWTGRYGFAGICFLTGLVPWVYHVLQRGRQPDEPLSGGKRTAE